MSSLTIQMTRPRATTQSPRKASFITSSMAGVKYSAPSSAYSKTASTNHMMDAPQNMRLKNPSCMSPRSIRTYHAMVDMIAAKTVIKRVMSAPPVSRFVNVGVSRPAPDDHVGGLAYAQPDDGGQHGHARSHSGNLM